MAFKSKIVITLLMFLSMFLTASKDVYSDESQIVESADRILGVILSMQPWYQDVEAPDRDVHLYPVAEAIAKATDNKIEQAALMALAYEESKMALFVVGGRCLEGPAGARCDNGKARGVWQLWKVACPSAYEYPAGSYQSTVAEAKCAIRLLRGGKHRCKGMNPAGDWAGAFSAYAGGASCQRPKSAGRQKMMWLMLHKLETYKEE